MNINILQDRIRGSLIGGAIGDALGYPVEFIYSFEGIQAHYGERGITRLDTVQHWLEESEQVGKAVVSDDTQMTLFTANGLLNAKENGWPGIKGAQATAICILMARQGATKEEIHRAIAEDFRYNLAFTCDGIRESYKWGATCQDTVPQAIVAFLDGNDFEDCLRNAVSIGGDSDTLACITGSIAEAYYGIPRDIYIIKPLITSLQNYRKL